MKAAMQWRHAYATGRKTPASHALAPPPARTLRGGYQLRRGGLVTISKAHQDRLDELARVLLELAVRELHDKASQHLSSRNAWNRFRHNTFLA